jgi:hypothetical protein
MWRAVQRGFVDHDKAVFVANGLRHGFLAGIDVAKMTGHRWFRNYPSALEERHKVTMAIMDRVSNGKTVNLGRFTQALGTSLRRQFGSSAIFPMGAVGKPLEPWKVRPTDDHTRTGLNACTDMSFLSHTFDTYKEIAWFLKQDYWMRVSDVDGAFTILPFHYTLWPFLLFRFFESDNTDALSLFCHVTGDFGTAGFPGVFKIFFVDVVCNMARSEFVLSLPTPVYVDDMGMIGPVRVWVDAQMEAFHAWCESVCGVHFKALKDRLASQRQFMLGFWWDSRTFTRTLGEDKLHSYVDTLTEYASRSTLTLKEMQSAAGKLQRACMTLPPGVACMLAGLFTLMVGLRLPWHRRRLTKQVRGDIRWVLKLLEMNLGSGWYSYDHFPWAPEVTSDASKSRHYTGGGFVSRCGMHGYFRYGTSASRKCIDFLEGDTVVCAVDMCGHAWAMRRVPFGIDNMAFEKSGEKGMSRAPRLNDLLRELFAKQVQYRCVLDFFWLSTHDNLLADHLSRNRVNEFYRDVYATGYWEASIVPRLLQPSGHVRVLPEIRGGGLKQALQGRGPSLRKRGAGPTRRRTEPLIPAVSLVGSGLPERLRERVDSILDNRYGASSWHKIKRALAVWTGVAEREGWDVLIATGDPERGAKMVTFVMELVEDTDLVYSSIDLYVWALCAWHHLQHQASPTAGVLGWSEFMDSVKVLTFVPAEPRAETPLAVVRAIVADADLDSVEDVQFVFWMLLMLYTYSRTESPNPKSFTGREAYDSDKHFNVQDFDIRVVEMRRCLMARFRVLKPDQRMERPAARGDGDWVCVGEIRDSDMCPVRWFLRLQRMHGHRPVRDGPMFLARDRVRPYIYSAAASDFQARQARVGVPEEARTAPHGLRVAGYNATKRALGEDIAAAHGGWQSGAHTRYSRYYMSDVVRIPSVVCGDDAGEDYGICPDERPTVRSAQRPTRALARRPSLAGDSDIDEPESGGGSSAPVGVAPTELALPQGARMPLVPSPADRGARRGRRPAGGDRAITASLQTSPLVSEAPASTVGSMTFRFPDDLSTHEGYFERPSRRPPPTARNLGAS